MTDPLLEVENINTSYGDSQVLFDVSLTVEEGQLAVLLGRNGAGKTTTLRSIMGIQKPSSGTIKFRGEDITDDRVVDVAKRNIKYIPEDRRVFDKLTVEEHIVMGVDPDYRSKEEEFERIFDIFPALRDLRHKQAENLSGGEQQMLVTGRALVGETDLVLMDEPSEGLAPQIVDDIFNTIRDLKNETTILLVEQNYPKASSVADEYFLIDQGQIVSEGDIEKLDGDDELKSKYLGVA